MARLFLALSATLFVAMSAIAHPLLEIRYDRNVAVRLDPRYVRVNYTVEMNLLAMTLDGKSVVSAEEVKARDPDAAFVRAYVPRKGILIADSLVARLDGRLLKFELDGPPDVFPEPGNTFRIVYRLRATWSTELGTKHRFEFEDSNFLEEPGVLNLTVDEAEKKNKRLRMTSSVEATDLRGRSDKGLAGKDLERRRKCTAEFELQIPPLQAGMRLLCFPLITFQMTVDSQGTSDIKLIRLVTLLSWSWKGTEHECVIALPLFAVARNAKVATSRPNDPAGSIPAGGILAEAVIHPTTAAKSIITDIWDRGLVALFDSTAGVAVILFMAFLFGMGHAVTPGHGKTMVAAYLVGERGTPRHAVVLGFTSTLAHTGSVIVLACVLYSAYGNTAPASAQAWLNLGGGMLIFLVGLWLFRQRIRGRADHVHLFGAHHHADQSRSLSWVRVVLLGLGGGIIPCWDAVLLFLLAMAQGRIGFALPVLLAFSTGLAVVLIALGLGVVYARRRGAARFGEARWFRFLPMASALVLLGMGLWFLRDGWQGIRQASSLAGQ